ncbi:hypothetical protein HPB47_000222, partial [Ixodes persulcatus]
AAGTPPLPTSGRQSTGSNAVAVTPTSNIASLTGGGLGLGNNGGIGSGNHHSDSDSGMATPNHASTHHGTPHHTTSPAAQPRATPPLKTSTSSPPSSQEPHRGSAPFNLSDFSSSQTLLNLVRTASAQSASQLETYLRGAVKRPHEGEQARADPLDLSVGTAVKRPRSTDSPRSASKGDVDGATVAASPSRKQATSPWLLLDGRGSSKSPKLRCGSVCSDQASPCATAEASPQGVAKWTVDEVVHFVASVDSCQEYAESFTPRYHSDSVPDQSPLAVPSPRSSPSRQQPAKASSPPRPTGLCLFPSSRFRGACECTAGLPGSCSRPDRKIHALQICDRALYGSVVELPGSKFREQSIDGTSLPLLTEDHLTVYMGMRLGPALKLRTSLAKLTGRCTVCMHCIHCHGEDNDRRSTSSASSTPATGGSTGCAPLPASSTPPMVPPAATPPATVSASSPASSK